MEAHPVAPEPVPESPSPGAIPVILNLSQGRYRFPAEATAEKRSEPLPSGLTQEDPRVTRTAPQARL
jgi:hypothetical protein